MSDEDLHQQTTSSIHSKSSQNSSSNNLRQLLIERQLNDSNISKKKKSPLSNWDKLRDNVNEFSDNGVLVASPTASSSSSSFGSIPTSSRGNTKASAALPKKQTLNPFMRSATFDGDMKHGNHMTLANTTLVAAQAAGMTNFNRNFRPARHQNGVIYATSTAVQQDIYRLERDLDKLLVQLNARSQHASFAESTCSTLLPGINAIPTLLGDSNQTTTLNTKKGVFQKQNMTDLFQNEVEPPVIKPYDVTRISFIMSAILESIKKHKSATRLPLTGEILAIMVIPFDKSPLIISDCEQALDMFEYIKRRFTQINSTEQFEQIIFTCRLLGVGTLALKKRVLGLLESLLKPCLDNTSFLPSMPTAYHSLVYTLTNALAQLNIDKHQHTVDEIKEHAINDMDMDESLVRSGIFEILDNLVNGSLIPPVGPAWSAYHTNKKSIPSPTIAQLCVVEALLKCVMVGTCSQSNPYHGLTTVSSTSNLIERTRHTLVIQELLPKYWIEPIETKSARPAYFKIIFLITELANEALLNATIDDLTTRTSTAFMLLPWIMDKLSPSKLQSYLIDQHTDELQKMTTSNLIVTLLSLLSICNMEENASVHLHSNVSSPNLSPRPSVPDFVVGSDMSISEAHSLHSFRLNVNTDIAVRKLLLSSKSFVEEFWKSGYKDFMLRGIEAMLQDTISERTAIIYQNLVFHLDPVMSEEIAKKTLPTLFLRLVETLPPALPELCKMLYALSKRYRTLFYKPVVSCAASDDEEKVSTCLALMTCLRRYLSGVEFWMQDAEMINVLLLSDVGPKKLKNDDGWGNTTLGQCVVAGEFMWAVKDLRTKQRDPHRNMEEDEIAKKFLIDLERRLAVFLAAKEKTSWVPMPLRNILCNIFLDLRFFCNTTHRPGWLARVIDWAIQPVISTPEHAFHPILPTISPDQSPSPNNPPSSLSELPLLHTGHLTDLSVMFQRIHNVYINVVELLQLEIEDSKEYTNAYVPPVEERIDQTPPRHKRQQTIQAMYPITRSALAVLDLSPPSTISASNEFTTVEDGPALKLARYRFENMQEINQDAFGAVFSLLAAVFTALSSQEFSKLVRPLWERHMDDRKPHSFIPAVFLLMECGEKIPKTMIEVCTHDFYSGDPLRRLAVIQKHSSLSAFRFNVLNQEYIPISSRRRPFRGDGGAFSTPFVPTDLGSNQFTLDEPRWMAKLKNASNFPIELKRQIQELGWDDDDNGEEHEALKKVLTPLALLPSLFLEEEDERLNEDDTPTATAKHHDISKIITRRKRATTIHSLTISFLSMVDLLNDDYGGASNALRELLEYFLRDDPAMFLRAFLSDLGKFKLDRHRDMLTRLRYLVSMQHKLPPGFTHILFNYLAGMLKWLMRESKNKKDGLVLMTLVHPILAELTLSTNDLSIRDLRKNKIEHLLVSTGRFWFTHEQPTELFPRYLSNNDKTPFNVLDIPPEIFSVAMLRISHIQFLTNYLTRYPREVYAVKKTMQDYEPTPIPGSTNKRASWSSADDTFYYPDIARRKRYEPDAYIYKPQEDDQLIGIMDNDTPPRQSSQRQLDTEMLSALRARIWLRFVDHLLNGLNKNYNDRDELERILQGINAIITEHDRDFGIIGQALILYTRVVTRFKRLFISNRGYTTFLPALFKVFCEVDCFPQVRSAIIFAWCRFYAVHEESFVFQMLGTLVPTILSAYTTSEDLGDWMLDNLFVLMQAMHDPPHLGATSDVLGLQLQVELDDHERSIQERIDAASNPMTIPLSTAILKPLARSVTSPIAPLDIHNYNNRSFELQNFIKLFLTVIAYDAGSLRAEQFVKIFCRLIPRFHKVSVLKELINEGITALIDVFYKFSKHAKITVNATPASASTSGGYQGISLGLDGERPGISSGHANRTESAQHAYGKQWQQNDKLAVRMEFVLLVHEYLKHEGSLSEPSHQKMAFIICTVMRDYGKIKNLQFKTDWIKDYLIDCLNSMTDSRNYIRTFKYLTNQIFSQYRSQWRTMDGSGLYDGLAIILERGQGKPVNMHDIASVMSEKFVSFGITVATTHDWESNTKGHTKFCNSLVRLIIAILENSTQDVLYGIEQQTPTPELIGYILIPICLQYNLQWDYTNISMPTRFKPDPTSHWTRLLNYISRACSQASLLKSKSSGGFSLPLLTSSNAATQDNIDEAEFADLKDRKQTSQSVALLFSLSFVCMKIILVRGSNAFNKLKGSWAQVAFFIKSALVFGQTLKSMKPKSGRSSPVHMPTTPITGGLSPGGLFSSTSPGFANVDSRAVPFSFTAPLGTATIYDFTTWRFLEFVTCYRCPLLVFLKSFIHERLLDMGGNTLQQRSSLYVSPRISMNFGASSPPTSTRWKSWGGQSTSPSTQQQPQSPQTNVANGDKSTNGLGLHIPSFSSGISASRGPPAPSSPSLSVNDFSDIERLQQQTLNRNNGSNRPTSSSYVQTAGQGLFQSSTNRETSTVLHVLHAESITSIVHVQVSMGFKPALPWMSATNNPQRLKPWSHQESVVKFANEWQLLLQLHAEELDVTTAKTNSNNVSNNLSSSPFV